VAIRYISISNFSILGKSRTRSTSSNIVLFCRRFLS
jgi:hypothetical protein